MLKNEIPTIIDPIKYKMRFRRAINKYFVGMIRQDDKN